MEMMTTYLMKLYLREYVPDEAVCTEGNEEKNSECAQNMMKRVCLFVYADWSRGSRVCTRKITCQVAYGLKRSKSAKPRVTTMVLTHGIG